MHPDQLAALANMRAQQIQDEARRAQMLRGHNRTDSIWRRLCAAVVRRVPAGSPRPRPRSRLRAIAVTSGTHRGVATVSRPAVSDGPRYSRPVPTDRYCVLGLPSRRRPRAAGSSAISAVQAAHPRRRAGSSGATYRGAARNRTRLAHGQDAAAVERGGEVLGPAAGVPREPAPRRARSVPPGGVLYPRSAASAALRWCSAATESRAEAGTPGPRVRLPSTPSNAGLGPSWETICMQEDAGSAWRCRALAR
jgi:hypothetical protein